MKIALLECDHVAERFRHIAGDYRDMFSALITNIELKPFDVCNGEMPLDIDDCDAYLCTGSRYSVYDENDWITELKAFVRRAHDAGKPFVGICFGHQMLAEALGGKVAKAEQGWGVGVHNIEMLRSETWMQPQRTACKLQFMHQDQVLRLPEDSKLLGRSDHCPIAMFSVGKSMLGIQAHPEFISAYSEALLLDRVERIGEERVKDARESLKLDTDRDLFGEWIIKFLNWDREMNHGEHGDHGEYQSHHTPRDPRDPRG